MNESQLFYALVVLAFGGSLALAKASHYGRRRVWQTTAVLVLLLLVWVLVDRWTREELEFSLRAHVLLAVLPALATSGVMRVYPAKPPFLAGQVVAGAITWVLATIVSLLYALL